MTLLQCQNRFEVQNEWLSATENIGQVFLTSGFALSGCLLLERTPSLPKMSGAGPISASFSAIHQQASTLGFEL